jgi:Tn3 transposase DDE domain
VLRLIDRLKVIREIELPPHLARSVHQNRLLQLAREGAQTDVPHLRDFETTRHHGTLVAILLESTATLTDEILDMHDRIVGSAFAKAKQTYTTSFQESAKAINEKVRLYAKVGNALIEAKKADKDAFAAIEQIVSWEQFTQSVNEVDKLARSEDFDYLGLVGESYSQFRRYAPEFIEAFEFRAAPVAQNLVDAIAVLRVLNANKTRRIPDDTPKTFVRQRWTPFVFTDDGIDRRYYELCVLAELKNALRSGDLWVQGSRQFKDFEDYLLPKERFNAMRSAKELPIDIDTNADTYLSERLERLQEALARVNALAANGELPDADIQAGVLKVTPLTNDVPEKAGELMRQAYARLPHLKITELLLEIDHWTGFSRHFTHLKSQEPATDKVLLLTAILADAINLGLTKMAEACPGSTVARLSWLSAWHIRDETYSKALAEIVNFQHRLPLAEHWGEGTTSSSDGQRFRAGGRAEATGQVNLRYSNEPGALFYTHISDQYAPFHTKVINATVRDATHVLDGLLYHESDLKIEEHYTDTAGFTDHVFALCHLLGFRFAPRIRDLADKRLYVSSRSNLYPALSGLIGGTINLKQIFAQWQEALRLTSSIRQGTVTASLTLRKLGSYPRQNGLASP